MAFASLCEKKRLKELMNQKKKKTIYIVILFNILFMLFSCVKAYFDMCFNLSKSYPSHHYYKAQVI